MVVTLRFLTERCGFRFGAGRFRFVDSLAESFKNVDGLTRPDLAEARLSA
jgi:hypothetical protein